MNVNPPVNRFDGGMTADARDAYSRSQKCVHFDNYTKPHSLIPFRDSVDAGLVAQTTLQMYNFLIPQSTSAGSTVFYAQGRQVANTWPVVYENSDLAAPQSNWSQSHNSAGSSGDGTGSPMFVEYEDAVYGNDVVNSRVWAYDIAGNAFTYDVSVSARYKATSHGFVKEGKLYFGSNNVLVRKTTGGGVTGNWGVALTLPSSLVITSLCDYGNLLGIACRPVNLGSSNSFLFLWDTSSPTWNEKVDWGPQFLQCAENIDGYIVGVSISGNQANGIIQPKLVFRHYSGSGAIQFEQIYLSSGSGAALIVGKQKNNNRLYFGLSGATSTFTDAVTNDFTGIWSVGRNGITAPFTVNMVQKPNNDTMATAIKGFYLAKDYFYISYLDQSSAWTLSVTNSSVSYTATAIYRTVINPRMGLTRYTVTHNLMKKRLISAALTYVPVLRSSDQVVLKFRVDNGSWQTCFTRTNVVGEQAFEAQNASGTEFNTGRDFEFEIQSNGVEVTGLIYKYEALETLI